MKPGVAWTLRAVLSASLLTWILTRPELKAFLPMMREAKIGWLVSAFICGGVSLAGLAWRWNICLRAMDVSLPWSAVLRITLAASAAGFFSIGQLGVDAAKVLMAGRIAAGRKAALVASVGIDHVSAIPVMGALFLTAALVHGLVPVLERHGLLILAGAVVLTLVGRCVVRWKWKSLHDRILKGLTTPRMWRGTCLAALASLPVWLAYCGVFYCSARAVGVTVPAIPFMSVTAIADALAALPVSVAGLGVREQAFRFLLEKWHQVVPEAAVALSLSGFVIMLLWGLAGCMYWLREPKVLSNP